MRARDDVHRAVRGHARLVPARGRRARRHHQGHRGGRTLEPAYHGAAAVEFNYAGLRFRQQVRVPARYRGHVIGDYRLDFVVEDLVVVEIKAVERMHPLF